MLLSNDKRFVILTPTKTGTFSLEAALKERGGWEQRMPRHGMEIPKAWHKATVLVMCRNPYHRLVSMYHYGKVKKHSRLLKWGQHGFPAFVRNWLDARAKGKPHDWVTLVSEYLDAARETNLATECYPLEEQGVKHILQRLGCPELERHNNRSADRFTERPQDLWTPELVRLARPVLLRDIRLGNYSAFRL